MRQIVNLFFFLANSELDFALVAVGMGPQVLELFGRNPLIEAEGKAVVGEFVTSRAPQPSAQTTTPSTSPTARRSTRTSTRTRRLGPGSRTTSSGAYRTFQVPMTRVEAVTGLSFGSLRDSDPLAGLELAAPGREIRRPTDLRI
jgi:hypothetical protein